LGFRKIITIDELRKAYPYQDWVDRNRWPDKQLPESEDFPAIEAVVCMGEPIRWETNLQLIIDVLVTQGKLNQEPNINGPQIPVLAVNMDLLWMAKAKTPRFGHGAFLVCLENLYKKIVGRDLQYTALIGKPSEITYEFSQKVIEEIASAQNIPTLETIYAIGDNPLTDIYGANMYNKFQAKKKEQMEKRQKERNAFIRSQSVDQINSTQCSPTEADYTVHGDILNVQKCTRCSSLLVCTGVYQPPSLEKSSGSSDDEPESPALDHGHRDLPYTDEMTRADHIVTDVKAALDKIFELESWQPLAAAVE
jgi:HAD superfamily hydrolase (TIGR01450 family)